MNFTFGIIYFKNFFLINEIIKSIENENIPNYEIIIVGNYPIHNDNIMVIPFNETEIPNCITKKKNIITEKAKYDNIVFLHDYIKLNKDWYEGFLKFGNDWEVCMCKIFTNDGQRGIDWMGLPNDNIYGNVLHPYDYCNQKGMYIPGNFWVAKKDIMVKYKLDEKLCWGQAEDIEWSKRILGGYYDSDWLRNLCHIPLNTDMEMKNREVPDKIRYKMNQYSSVSYLKHKPTPIDFYKKFDCHSGDNSRPKNYNKEDYLYLKYR